MYGKGKIVNWLSLILSCISVSLLLANILIPDYALGVYIAVFTGILIFGVALGIDKFLSKDLVITLTRLQITGIVLFLLFVGLIPELLHFDKLYAVHPAQSWLNKYIMDIFPYSPQEGYPAFPVYYALILPFYLVNAIELFPVLGIILFAVVLIFFSEGSRTVLIRLFLFLFTFVLFYQSLSGYYVILFVTAASGLVLLGGDELYYEKKQLILFVLAPLWGLLLSSWTSVWLLFFFFTVFHFKQRIWFGLQFAAVSIAVFLIFLSPFLFPNTENFFLFGPLSLPIFEVSLWILIPLILVGLYVSYVVSDAQEILFASGLFAFVIGVVSVISQSSDVGFTALMTGAAFNPVCFLSALVCFILAQKEYVVDEYLGKVLPINKPEKT